MRSRIVASFCTSTENRTGAPDGVFELAVAILVGQPSRGEQPPRACGVVRVGGHVGRIPRTDAAA